MSDDSRDRDKIRITLEDLQTVQVPQTSAMPAESVYGRIPGPSEPADTSLPEEKGAIYRKAWFYLGAASMLGALVAWAICEPWFIDGPRQSWADIILIPLVVTLMCVGLGIAEATVEHSPKRALIRGLIAVGAGALLGFIFDLIANMIFAIGTAVLAESGHLKAESPLFWLTRGIAWIVFGVSGGIIYGIVGQSGRKLAYGVLGGIAGSGIGGFLFDPIAMGFKTGAVSRAVGFALFGAATGVAIGLVENALKDRWLYVAAGPLAGKQFVLYKRVTVIGSSQTSDIYLFKDAAIAAQHATLELRGPRVFLRAHSPLVINGRSVSDGVLRSGDYIQIGRYGFHYRDRERTGP